MSFMIFDDTGNAIDTFEDGDAARDALCSIVAEDASAVRELAIVALDDEGHVVGDAEIAADIVPAAAHLIVLEDSLLSCRKLNAETFSAMWQHLTAPVQQFHTAAGALVSVAA